MWTSKYYYITKFHSAFSKYKKKDILSFESTFIIKSLFDTIGKNYQQINFISFFKFTDKILKDKSYLQFISFQIYDINKDGKISADDLLEIENSRENLNSIIKDEFLMYFH